MFGGQVCEWVGKALLYMMVQNVSSSDRYSSSSRLYEFNLLYRNLMAANLCCEGCLEKYGMMVSVKVAFLYMKVFHPLGVLCMVTSR